MVLLLPASVDDPVHQVVTLLSREMLLAEPGGQTVLDRLLDVLVTLLGYFSGERRFVRGQ